jgi:hypothetical protein
MIAMTLVGAAFGACVFAVIWRLVSPRPSALVQLARFDAHVEAHRDGRGDATGSALPLPAAMTPPVARPSPLGAWLERQLALRGVAYTSLRQDLALTGQSFPVVLSRKILTAAAGFVLVAATGLALQTLAAVPVPGAALAVAGAATAVAASFLPDLEARRLAAARRREFRRALAAYLDLVALEMAGSAAPTEALPNAARVGTGWPMALLRDTLWRAGLSGQDSWEALADLGQRIGVAELRDLAGLIRLVGRDGARVRQTLTARAAGMRRRELADAEGEAGQKDQSMRLAQILIGVGFMAFLTYPAVVNVLAL